MFDVGNFGFGRFGHGLCARNSRVVAGGEDLFGIWKGTSGGRVRQVCETTTGSLRLLDE